MPNANNNKMSPRRTASLDRELKAIELRKRGYTYREIGRALVDEQYPNGISGKSAFRIVERAFKKLNAQSNKDTETLRTLEMERLDAMRKGLYDAAISGDTSAVLASLKISERLAKLTGLDQPMIIETKSTIESIDEDRLARVAEAYLGNAGNKQKS